MSSVANQAPEQIRINTNAKEERKLMKPGGTGKLNKKHVKLPILNTGASRGVLGDEQSNMEQQQSEMRGVQQQAFLKNNIVEKYQQYTQAYQKQISNKVQKLEVVKHQQQSFSTKNLHQPTSLRHILDQESHSNDNPNQLNFLQKSQSKDSLQLFKMKTQVMNNNSSQPIKLQHQYYTSIFNQNNGGPGIGSMSSKSKNTSLGTIVIKKDQIRLNNKLDSIGSNNTLKNSDSKLTSNLESNDLQIGSTRDKFINESIKPSIHDGQLEGQSTEYRPKHFQEVKQDEEMSQHNLWILEEDNPFLVKKPNAPVKGKKSNLLNQFQKQQPQSLQPQQQHMFQIPPQMINQMMLMYPPPPGIFQNMPPQLNSDQAQLLMNPYLLGIPQNQQQQQPMGFYYPMPYGFPPAPSPQQLQQLQIPQQQQQTLHQHNQGQPPNFVQKPQQNYDEPPSSQLITTFQIQQHNKQTQQYQPQIQQDQLILIEKPHEVENIEPHPFEKNQQATQPIQLNKKKLNQNEDEIANATNFMNINPFDDDDELCNYEATEARDLFSNVLRDSEPIVIVDDREDDDLRSSLYYVKSKMTTHRKV